MFYADTTALIRAYFADEPDHEPLRRLLLEGTEPVVTTELTRVEFASAVAAAYRAHRVARPSAVLDRFDADCGEEGSLTLLRLDPEATLPMAYQLVTSQKLRTLDAIHLAVALTEASALAAGEPVTLVTRDEQQAAAAVAQGLTVV